jgi:ribosomal protein L11 methyltransferase
LGKAWPALEIHVPGCDAQLEELVLAELDDFHPTAVQESDGTSPLRAFFTTDDARTAAARAIGSAFGSYIYVKPIDVEDEDWAARSQAQLTAITVGRITVAPPWDTGVGRGFHATSPKTSPDPCIRIQPSTGFGTGHHATTRLMLKALQNLPLDNRTVLDIGCGSGVLAIAAIKLGARSAVGVDIDPDALENARENVELNGEGERIRFEESDFREISAGADVVLANLTGALLERSAEQLAQLVVPGGSLVVSGFMDSETNVSPALEAFLTLEHVDAEGEWRCATYRNGKGGAAFTTARV